MYTRRPSRRPPTFKKTVFITFLIDIVALIVFIIRIDGFSGTLNNNAGMLLIISMGVIAAATIAATIGMWVRYKDENYTMYDFLEPIGLIGFGVFLVLLNILLIG